MSFEEKCKQIEKDLFTYFDLQSPFASSDRYNWNIGAIKIWVANGPDNVEIAQIPVKYMTKDLKEKIWLYYHKWLDNYYKFEI